MSKTINITRTKYLLIFIFTAFLFSCGNGSSSELCQEKVSSDTASAPEIKNYSLKSGIPCPEVNIEVADPENDLCSVTFKFYYPDDEETLTDTSSFGRLDRNYNNDTDIFDLDFSFNMGPWESWRMDIILIDREGNNTTIKDVYFTKKELEENHSSETFTPSSTIETETESTYQPATETEITLETQYAPNDTQTIPGTISIMAH